MFSDQKLAPLKSLKKRLESSKAPTFISLTSSSRVSMTAVLRSFTLQPPFTRSKSRRQGVCREKQYALAIFKGLPKGRNYDWWVEDVRFPYERKTFAAPEKAVDDGHGHGSH